MVDKKPIFSPEPEEEEYEILPHKELKELKEELHKLKEFEISPTKKMHVTMVELNHKLDKLITIFEDAMHEIRIEEGGLSFSEKMSPMLEKMNKILEQNSEIASGILAVADMVKEVKGEPVHKPMMSERMPKMHNFGQPPVPPPPIPPQPGPDRPPRRAEPEPPVPPPPVPPGPDRPPRREGLPPPPPPPKRRSFGL